MRATRKIPLVLEGCHFVLGKPESRAMRDKELRGEYHELRYGFSVQLAAFDTGQHAVSSHLGRDLLHPPGGYRKRIYVKSADISHAIGHCYFNQSIEVVRVFVGTPQGCRGKLTDGYVGQPLDLFAESGQQAVGGCIDAEGHGGGFFNLGEMDVEQALVLIGDQIHYQDSELHGTATG